MREDQRNLNSLREIKITPHVMPYAEGSAQVQFGKTKVLCSASASSTLPKWLRSSQQGWVTAEYNMLPRSTSTRIKREKSFLSGRSQEISRLIGRSLRSCCQLQDLTARQIHVDCDVIHSDGGTRVASITGGFVALALAIQKLLEEKIIQKNPLIHYVSGVSVAILNDQVILDPTAKEDLASSTDMNIVYCSRGDFIEIQGTAEKHPFNQKELQEMLDQSRRACDQIFKIQSQALNGFFPLVDL